MVPAAALSVEPAAILAALGPFKTAGRQVNGVAFSLNSASPVPPDMSLIAKIWPKAAEDVLCAARPDGVDICPVPVQATPPQVVRRAHPAFRQHPVGTRQRQTVIATRVSAAEHAHVQATAERAGLDTADFFRSRLIGCDPLHQRRLSRQAARALAAALEECGRQANNFRQIAKVCEGRRWPVPDIVHAALSGLWEIRSALMPTLARWRQ